MSESQVISHKSQVNIKKNIVLLQGIFEPSFFKSLKKDGVKDVFIMEGRPSLSSAKFNAKELAKHRIKPTLIADNMAGFLFFKKMVKEVRIAYQILDRKGAFCSTGALILGVLAKRHKVPVYLHKGVLQDRLLGQQKEISFFNGKQVAPDGIKGYVPLIEWVSDKYVTKVCLNGHVEQ